MPLNFITLAKCKRQCILDLYNYFNIHVCPCICMCTICVPKVISLILQRLTDLIDFRLCQKGKLRKRNYKIEKKMWKVVMYITYKRQLSTLITGFCHMTRRNNLLFDVWKLCLYLRVILRHQCVMISSARKFKHP